MFRWAVNFVLLALPIGVTLGVLLALESGRASSGQGPLFSPPDNNGNGGPGVRINNTISPLTYCDKAMGIHPETKGQAYTLNPNQWGWDEKDGGGLCMNVSIYNNQSYPTKLSAPEWSVTWEYGDVRPDQPVHAFPNALVDDVFPLRLDGIDSINLDFDWTYGLGNDTAAKTDRAALEAQQVNANVAMDMFLHTDKAKSSNSSTASHEIMIWFAAIGAATQPIGMATNNTVATKTLDGTEFTLYSGKNGEGQSVLTWYSDSPAEHFTGDLMPLIAEILAQTKTATFDPPGSTYYLGYMSLGTEAYSSPKFVTFHVPTMEIEVKTK